MESLHSSVTITPPPELEGVREILLHTCCAPCAASIIECLMERGFKPTIYYCNPNIYPEEEYLKRKGEITQYCKKLSLQIVDDDYDHETWLGIVKGLEEEPERGKRCLECFKYRLTRTAKWGSENGYRLFATTLASSRWKLLTQINEAGEYATSQYPDVKFLAQNWRKGGLTERRRALIEENSFYNQRYCGCEFSLRRGINE